MGNRTIPEEDKQLVTQRLAEGMSTRQAIEGTTIASNQTAARLAKAQSHAITQIRIEYLEMINHYAFTDLSKLRASSLADMLKATKIIKTGHDRYTVVDDWETIFKAVKYIDMLAGITNSNGSQINVVQQVNNR
jgi:hypothetical protein